MGKSTPIYKLVVYVLLLHFLLQNCITTGIYIIIIVFCCVFIFFFIITIIIIIIITSSSFILGSLGLLYFIITATYVFIDHLVIIYSTIISRRRQAPKDDRSSKYIPLNVM